MAPVYKIAVIQLYPKVGSDGLFYCHVLAYCVVCVFVCERGGVRDLKPETLVIAII